MSDQTPLDVEAIRARLDAATFTAEITFDNRGGDGEFFKHAPTDLRRLLDERESLRVHNGVLVTEIRFQADRAEKAIADRDRADRQIRVHLDIARAAERERDEAIREAAADKAKLAAVRDVITPKNPDWKPLTERHPEYFAPVSPEEAARKKGWGQGVALLTQQIQHALDGPEMPRPPAEEAQERPGTFPAGSGRGTGVTGAQGAQADLSLIPAGLIKSDPGIRGGEPCITGTRIPAHEVAGYLADGATWEQVREMLPSLPSLPVPSTEEGQ